MLKLRAHGFANAEKGRFLHGVPRNENDVHTAPDFGNQRCNSLAHAPLYAVSRDAVADFFADGKADFRLSVAVFCIHQRKQPSPACLPGAVRVSKFLFPPQGIDVPQLCRFLNEIKLKMQTCGKQMPAASACAFVFFSENTFKRLRAQNFAAFGAPAFDDVAAVGRLHAFAESMHLAPLTFFRLIGPYH